MNVYFKHIRLQSGSGKPGEGAVPNTAVAELLFVIINPQNWQTENLTMQKS